MYVKSNRDIYDEHYNQLIGMWEKSKNKEYVEKYAKKVFSIPCIIIFKVCVYVGTGGISCIWSILICLGLLMTLNTIKIRSFCTPPNQLFNRLIQGLWWEIIMPRSRRWSAISIDQSLYCVHALLLLHQPDNFIHINY